MCLYYETKFGVAEIRFRDGRFRVSFSGQELGCYHSADDAIDELASGRISLGAFNIELSKTDIPSDRSKWCSRK